MGARLSFVDYVPGHRERLEEIRAAAFAPVFASFRALLGPAISDVALARAEEEQGEQLDDACAGKDGAKVYFAKLGGEIAGFATVTLDFERKVGTIGLNAVDPALANRGIGTAMYDFALERMREAGMKAAEVGTGLDESHAPARAAYAKVGFDKGIPAVHLYRQL